MSRCTYSSTPIHPDRLGGVRDPAAVLWTVLHTTEGGEGDASAEQLAGFLGRPGDRTTSSGSRYGSSYHAIADTGLHVIRAVPDYRVAFSAPGANTQGDHIVIPGRATQSREEWLEGSSAGAITTCAGYIVDRWHADGRPTERVSARELQAGTRGYCDHATVRDAFGQTTHFDVGPAFPWDFLAAEIRRLKYGQPLPNPLRKVDTMYVIRVTREGWPGPVDLTVAADGTRWTQNGHTTALDRLAGVSVLENVSKTQALGVLIDRGGIGAHPFGPGAYRDDEMAAAWTA